MTAARQSLSTPGMIVVLGCLIAMIAFGVRSTAGLFAVPMTSEYGWSRELFGLAFAIQNLVWGLAQPVAGALTDRYGCVRVVAGGGAIYALGTALLAVSDTGLMLNLSAGLLMGIGIASTSFALIMPAFGRLLPEDKRSWAFGLAAASSSAGQLLFAPLGQAFIAAFGWQVALFLLAVFLLLIIPMVLPFGAAEAAERKRPDGEVDMALMEVVAKAFGHGSFILLVFGFFVCGFHVSFIAVHMPAFVSDLGFSADIGSLSLAVIGLFNIVGAYCSGLFGSKYSRRYGLSFIYLARAIVIAVFIFTPITAASVLIFSACMGLLWLSTIPLTIGLVGVMFGTRHMAMIYGFVFLSHQVGSFLGVWLGGAAFDLYGNYDVIWYWAIALGVFSAIVHWPIKERMAPSFVAPAAE